ncbi:oligosaccharyl transferase subunit ost3/OST6 [Vanrija albida]|uniref:Oligosaccharyl transferase subunit ost3/OST6 n=1 Tax=Vanrija albida TaxID=181172 RepID=A0ABR3QGP2_9TREE
MPPGLPFHQRAPPRRLFPRLLGAGALLALTVFAWTSWLLPALHARAGVRAAHELAGLLLPAKAAPSPRLLVLQHTHRPQGGLETASRLTHAAYAAALGYAYEMDTREYVPRRAPKAERMMNKAHSLLHYLEAELSKPRGAEWILWSDADTVIADPAVPAHALVPPHRGAMYCAAQDHNGMNAGVMLLRVHVTTVRAVRTVIRLFESRARGAHTDQSAWGLMLRSDPGLAAGFYEMPKHWLNAYWLEDMADGPVLQIHHVNWLKELPFAPAIRHAVGVAREARARGGGGNGLHLMPQWRVAQDAAKEWWAKTPGGIASMRFLDEELGVLDANGTVVEKK